MGYIPLFRYSTGLTSAIDARRLVYKPESGVEAFSRCRNITIDDSGRPERCDGTEKVASFDDITGAVSHAGAFVLATKTALYSWLPGDARVGIRNGLTSSEKTYFLTIGDRLYYSNGFERGYVLNGTSYAWDYEAPVGGETKKVFHAPPSGTHLAQYNGRVYMAVGNVLYGSEHLAPHLFTLNRVFKVYENPITMIAVASGCLYIGTTGGVYTEVGSSFADFTHSKVANYNVLPGTLSYHERRYGEAMQITPYFTTQQGVCAGGPNGAFENITQARIVLPKGLVKGSAGFVDQHYICALTC